MQNRYTLFSTEQQEVKLAQEVYTAENHYIVYEIYRHQRGTNYKLINADTLETCDTKQIVSMDEYTGAGFYYYSFNVRYMRFDKLSELLTKALNEKIEPTVKDELSFELIGYSPKSIALFGDTKPIKDLLSAMGGKFNPRLTFQNRKKAGWIFSTAQKRRNWKEY